jgi:hypothetical protein
LDRLGFARRAGFAAFKDVAGEHFDMAAERVRATLCAPADWSGRKEKASSGAALSNNLLRMEPLKAAGWAGQAITGPDPKPG